MRPASSSFQVAGVDRLHLLDLVIGVEARRFHHLRLGIGRHQVVGPEQEGLDQIVPARHGGQHALHRAAVGDVATGQQRQRAEADRAAQQAAAVDLRDERLVLGEDALIDRCCGPEERSRGDGSRHDALRSSGDVGRGRRFRRHGPRRGVELGSARHHRNQCLRNEQRKRHVHEEKQHDRGHAEEMHQAGALEVVEEASSAPRTASASRRRDPRSPAGCRPG